MSVLGLGNNGFNEVKIMFDDIIWFWGDSVLNTLKNTNYHTLYINNISKIQFKYKKNMDL
jgi:hypothetical protein